MYIVTKSYSQKLFPLKFFAKSSTEKYYFQTLDWIKRNMYGFCPPFLHDWLEKKISQSCISPPSPIHKSWSQLKLSPKDSTENCYFLSSDWFSTIKKKMLLTREEQIRFVETIIFYKIFRSVVKTMLNIYDGAFYENS